MTKLFKMPGGGSNPDGPDSGGQNDGSSSPNKE